ncbi:MAG TPA: GNAT family N-acetyltransferase [Lachnospiraceae bacterium]|nr:GNAT family N-acetyltransferase [Lachnospiraceae bacterium]
MIRRAKKEDIEGINKLLMQVEEIHRKIRPDIFKKDAKKYTDKELEKIINSEDTPIFVYIDERQLLGYAFCIFETVKDDVLLKDRKTLYIDDLCVDESMRGKHIGNMLYEHVLDFAKKSGCYNVTLNVWNGNDSAEGFYKKMGMVPQKTYMEKIL